MIVFNIDRKYPHLSEIKIGIFATQAKAGESFVIWTNSPKGSGNLKITILKNELPQKMGEGDGWVPYVDLDFPDDPDLNDLIREEEIEEKIGSLLAIHWTPMIHKLIIYQNKDGKKIPFCFDWKTSEIDLTGKEIS